MFRCIIRRCFLSGPTLYLYFGEFIRMLKSFLFFIFALPILASAAAAAPVVVMPFAFNAAKPADSLAHVTDACDARIVLFFDAAQQGGSGGTWRCVSTTGAAAVPGTIAHVAGVGIVMEGSNGRRWVRVPEQGNVIDVRSVGLLTTMKRTDPPSTQGPLFATILNAVRNTRIVLTGAGQYNTDRTLDFRRVNADLLQLRIQGGHQGESGGGGFFGAAGKPNTTTHTIDGVTMGNIVAAGASADAAEPLVQRIWVQGDGISNDKDRSTSIGVRVGNNSSAMSEYQFKLNYHYAGFMLTGAGGPQEKHPIQVHATYCNFTIYAATRGNSANTVTVSLFAQNGWHWYTEEDGFDGSVNLITNVEARNDPADDSPAFYIRNGKTFRLGGWYRAGNGTYQMIVDKTLAGGVDSLRFDDFYAFDVYGTWDIRRVRRLDGHFSGRDLKNPNTPGALPRAALKLGRIWHAGGFTADLSMVTAAEGVHIGDQANYPISVAIRGISVQMGNDDAKLGNYPTTRTALVVERMADSVLEMGQVAGNVVVGPQVTDSDIILQRQTRRYTLTNDAPLSTFIGIPEVSPF